MVLYIRIFFKFSIVIRWLQDPATDLYVFLKSSTHYPLYFWKL